MSLRLVAGIVLTVVLTGAGYRMGARSAELDCARAVSTASEEAAVAARQRDDALMAVERQAVEAEAVLERAHDIQTREVIRYVQSPDVPDCQLDAAGVRLWNAANAGAFAQDAAAGVAGAVPAAAAAPGRDAARTGDQPRAGGAGVSPLQPASGAAVAVGGGQQ